MLGLLFMNDNCVGCMQMDKASIVGDAVLYVQELQKQAKKLKAEIAGLESSLTQGERHQGSVENLKKIHLARNYLSICKKILQVLHQIPTNVHVHKT